MKIQIKSATDVVTATISLRKESNAVVYLITTDEVFFDGVAHSSDEIAELCAENNICLCQEKFMLIEREFKGIQPSLMMDFV